MVSGTNVAETMKAFGETAAVAGTALAALTLGEDVGIKSTKGTLLQLRKGHSTAKIGEASEAAGVPPVNETGCTNHFVAMYTKF